MAFTIITAPDFDSDVKNITDCIVNKWTIKEVRSFEKKLISVISDISNNPKIGKVSHREKEVRSFILTGHNRLYYQVFDTHVALLRIIDTRQYPIKNKFE